jgi:AraC family transcriptional activator of pobA
MDEPGQGLHNSNMPNRPTPAPSSLGLPQYSLYGEPKRALEFGWLHCESVAERSGLYGWEIQPHQHDALCQILHIRTGDVRVHSEGRQVDLQGPCVVTVPAGVAHGFQFSAHTEGTVVTVQEQHLHHLLRTEPGLGEQWRALRHGALDPGTAQAVGQAVSTLLQEQTGAARWRHWGVDLALQRLLLVLGRGLAEVVGLPAVHGQRATAHVRRFQALVEARFRQPLTVAQCSRELGITATQLNRVCQQVRGLSALGVVQQRIVLEAQRELAYTELSIKQIGLGLGFADAPYFTRFFVRHSGQTPTLWRAEQRLRNARAVSAAA